VLEPVRRQRIGWKVSAIAEIAQLKFIGVFFSCWPARRRHRRRFLFSFYFLSACLRIHYSGFALRISTDEQLRSRLITFLLKLSSWTMMWKCKRGNGGGAFFARFTAPDPGWLLSRTEDIRSFCDPRKFYTVLFMVRRVSQENCN
jgi:hypothetical protein